MLSIKRCVNLVVLAILCSGGNSDDNYADPSESSPYQQTGQSVRQSRPNSDYVDTTAGPSRYTELS